MTTNVTDLAEFRAKRDGIPIPAPVVTVLPKVTREEVLKEMPDLEWRRGTHSHLSNEECIAIANYKYEGRS